MGGEVARPLLTAAAARAGDEAAVAAGDTWDGLMARAAGHLARGVLRTAGRGYGLRVAIVVGKGDNGGDGWAAAPHLTAAGAQVRIAAVDGADADSSPATTRVRAAWLASGGHVEEGTTGLEALLTWADVAVDAVLGTGARGAPRGPAAAAVVALAGASDRGTPVIAADVPSGVDADTGAVTDGLVARATRTVTFGASKRGLRLHPGAGYAGEVVVGDLGPRYRPPDDRSPWSELTAAGAAPPPLPDAADKRARGVVRVVAGAVGTSGAAALCATAALRAGAGLVTVVVPEPVRAEVAARTDAGVMVVGRPSGAGDPVPGLPVARGRPSAAGQPLAGWAGGPDGQFAGPDDADLAGVGAVVAGPGLGHGDGVAAAIADLRGRAPRLVLDADALNVHRDDPPALADHAGELVLTPHERELARIGGGADGPDAWAQRVTRVPELAARYDATIVAKGPGTLVAAPDGRVWVCPRGGPALGSGGTGDVLAGVIGAAAAAEPATTDGGDLPLAVARAVWWHAAAGELAGGRTAGRASATDLLHALPQVLAALAAGTDPRTLTAGPVAGPGGRDGR